MTREQAMRSRTRAGRLLGVGLLLGGVLVALAGCSPEVGRPRGGGLGADVGNTSLPIRMHGDRNYNNPSFGVPLVGGVPRDAKGVAGWWMVGRAR